MSDPTLSDNDFKNKMAWVWTTLKLQVDQEINQEAGFGSFSPIDTRLNRIKNSKSGDYVIACKLSMGSIKSPFSS